MERLKVHKEAGQRRPRVAGRVRLERLGDFRILGEIGRGGMGIVYEAFQESLGRHVAVKVLPRQSLLDPKQLQRFQREAQTAARLHHTNIVPVFGVGEQEGFHYIVMQLIRGVGLDAVLGRAPAAGGPRRRGAAGDADAAARPLDPSEAIRLAEMLVQGQFWQAQRVRRFRVACPRQWPHLQAGSRDGADHFQPAAASQRPPRISRPTTTPR